MKSVKYIIPLFISLLAGGCITKFIPEIDESRETLVVEGMITDQPGINVIKLSKSVPLSSYGTVDPYRNCTVTIADDSGFYYGLNETAPGVYSTDSATFRGVSGRKYKLMIRTNHPDGADYTYESLWMELKTVPPIDSLYYEKVTITERAPYVRKEEGCQVYLDTHDPDGICQYYRWNFDETWIIQIPYAAVVKNKCWKTENSVDIKVKTTSILSEDRISRYPINFISNNSDRLSVRYSMLVNQFSLNEDEFNYWSKLQNVHEDIGGLYDVTPAYIQGNIKCLEDPSKQVLGYFSVSAVASERIYVDDSFSGLVDLYSSCPTDTVYGDFEITIPDLGSSVWIIYESEYAMPPVRILTRWKRCADCTTRGTIKKPDFWEDGE
jgi:hypothetical protein